MSLSYPQEWVSHVTWEGRDLTLRPIRPEDEALLAAFLDRCGPEDLRLRFFNARDHLTHGEIERQACIDYARAMTFVAVFRTAAGDEILGVAQAVCDPGNVEAEFALLVRSDLHRHGLGHLLLQRLIDWLAARGTQRIVGDVLHDNELMRALMHECGFAAMPSSDGVIRFTCALNAGTTPSLMEASPCGRWN